MRLSTTAEVRYGVIEFIVGTPIRLACCIARAEFVLIVSAPRGAAGTSRGWCIVIEVRSSRVSGNSAGRTGGEQASLHRGVELHGAGQAPWLVRFRRAPRVSGAEMGLRS